MVEIDRRTSGMYHALTWPRISFVAEDHKGRIVGYVLAKMQAGVSFLLDPTHASTEKRKQLNLAAKSLGTLTRYPFCDHTDA
jgi:hypothetical protein